MCTAAHTLVTKVQSFVENAGTHERISEYRHKEVARTVRAQPKGRGRKELTKEAGLGVGRREGRHGRVPHRLHKASVFADAWFVLVSLVDMGGREERVEERERVLV